MAIERPNFSRGGNITNPLFQMGGEVGSYANQLMATKQQALTNKMAQDRLDIAKAAEARTVAKAEQDAKDRAATTAYHQGLLGPRQQIAGGITDASNKAFGGQFGEIELTPDEQDRLVLSGGYAGLQDTGADKVIKDKIARQETFGEQLVKNAPMETRLQQSQRLLGESENVTPEMLKYAQTVQAADVATKKSTADTYKKSAQAKIDEANELALKAAKESSSIRDGNAAGRKGKKDSQYAGTDLQSYFATLDKDYVDNVPFVDSEEEIASDLFQKYTSEGVDVGGQKVKLSPKQSLELLRRATVEGEIDTDKINADTIKAVMEMPAYSGTGTAKSTDYYDALNQRIKALRGESQGLLNKAEQVYADPTQARIDTAAETYEGLLDNRSVPANAGGNVVRTEVPRSTKVKGADTPILGSDYGDKVAYQESRGSKNPYSAVNKTSKAMGKYQMLPSTLDDYRKELGGITDEEFLKSPEAQEKAFEMHTKAVEKYLDGKGVPVNDLTRWVGHNLGQGNAVKLFKGKMDKTLKNAIKENLPKGVEPTVDNYLERYMEMGNTGDDLLGRRSRMNADPVPAQMIETKKAADKVRMSELDKVLEKRFEEGNMSPWERTQMKLGLHPEQRVLGREQREQYKNTGEWNLPDEDEVPEGLGNEIGILQNRTEQRKADSITAPKKDQELRTLVAKAKKSPEFMERYRDAVKKASKEQGYIGTSAVPFTLEEFVERRKGLARHLTK